MYVNLHNGVESDNLLFKSRSWIMQDIWMVMIIPTFFDALMAPRYIRVSCLCRSLDSKQRRMHCKLFHNE